MIDPEERLDNMRLRLRFANQEVERLRRELSYHAHTDEDIKVQNAEIERLRERCEQYKCQVKAGSQVIEELRAEFKRFMDVCDEGTARERPSDLIDKRDWDRALRALGGKA